MNNKNKIVIGLTGQTGAGKSLLSEHLKSRGFYVINADICAREVVLPGTECLREVAKSFSGVINSDGSLNRKKLGNIVFSNPDKLSALNSVMNKYILDNIKAKIENSGSAKIILDAPTLFESGADRMCDVTLAVISDKSVRESRIINRDSLSHDEAQNRINAQNSDEFYIDRSDYVIKNNSAPKEMFSAADKIFDKIQPKVSD